MGPAKLMEVSPEGNFKDSITRKRWLGTLLPRKTSLKRNLARFTPPKKEGGKGTRPPKQPQEATAAPHTPSLKLRLIWHKFPPQKGAFS